MKISKFISRNIIFFLFFSVVIIAVAIFLSIIMISNLSSINNLLNLFYQEMFLLICSLIIIVLLIIYFILLLKKLVSINFIKNVSIKNKQKEEKKIVELYQANQKNFFIILNQWVVNDKIETAKALILLGQDNAADLLRQFSKDEINTLIAEITKITHISQEEENRITSKLTEELNNNTVLGLPYAQELLTKIVGSKNAKNIFDKIVPINENKPNFFPFLNEINTKQLTILLEEEQPQTMALILSYLEPEKAAKVLANLKEDVKLEVASRMAFMERPALEIITAIEKLIKERMQTFLPEELAEINGYHALANILTKIDKKERLKILTQIENSSPKIMKEIRNIMIVFEDILFLTDNEIKLVLTKVDLKDLILSLKTASTDLKEKIFLNMTDKVRKIIRKELAELGPVRLYEIENAKKRIAKLLEKLEANNDIEIIKFN